MILPPLSIYVHLPWCVRKCPYCDFNSHTAGSAPPKNRYLDALCKDLRQEAKSARRRQVGSVFLGGGTPSLFSPRQIGRVLDTIADAFDIVGDAEITMEANPGTVDCGAPAGYRSAGVNRLSVGAQSFDDSALQGLGRIHNSDDIVRTVAAAQAAGFDNINIDLMHALPGQTVDTALADLHAAMALGPQHISWYQLTLEPNTVFHARPPAGLPDNDLAFEIQEQGQAVLRSGRYRQYEVSAYAQAGRRCHHNLNYWLFGDYVAVGAGAHGKLTRDEGVCRYQKPAHPLQYMQTIEAGFSDAALVPLTDAERMFEFMLNGLRLNDGFAEALFRERTGLSTEALDTASADLRRRGLLERVENGVLRPTALGGRFLNDLQAEFLPETP
jgi:oxygen-independent coproporphyrinogen-3 oxidase